MKRHTELLIIKSKGLAIKHFSTFFALILQNRPIGTLNLIYCSQWSDWQFFQYKNKTCVQMFYDHKPY